MSILISTPFHADSYDRIIAACGGNPLNAFSLIVQEICKRFFSQMSCIPPSDAYLKSLAASIWSSVHAEGLPRPLAINEIGEAVTLEDSYLGAIVEKILHDLPRHRLDDLIHTLCFQIINALLAPEFKACRQSYDKRDATGECARQALDECKDRISGSHCEDCPFFIALSKDQHRKLLSRAFGPEHLNTFLNNTGVFLPEDFRSLRIFWHLHIRQPQF
jgi:hypothetical protein